MKISAKIKNVKGYNKILENILKADGIDTLRGHLNQILIACLLSRSRKIEVLEFEKEVNNHPSDVTIKYNNEIFHIEIKTINRNELDKILSKPPYAVNYDGKKTIEQIKEECRWIRSPVGLPNNPDELNIYGKFKWLFAKIIKQMSLREGNIIFIVTDARRIRSSHINNLLIQLNKVNRVKEFKSFYSWKCGGETIYTCIICNTSIRNANEEYLLKHYEKCRRNLQEENLKDILEKKISQQRLGIELNLIEKFKKCKKIFVLYKPTGRENFVWADNRINNKTNKYLLRYLRSMKYVSFKEDKNFKKIGKLSSRYNKEISTDDKNRILNELKESIDKLYIY